MCEFVESVNLQEDGFDLPMLIKKQSQTMKVAESLDMILISIFN